MVSQQFSLARVAAYLRVSTDEQRERATIETQRVEIHKRAVTDGIMLVDWYADDGWSGRKLTVSQRPEGARLLTDARDGRIDTVIVYRADRLGRGRKLLASADELLEAGVRYIISVTDATFDLKNLNDEFQLTMLSGVSGYESASFLQRSKDATNRLAHEGTWLGGIVPYGYYVEGEDRHARLTVSETQHPGMAMSEADVIRLIYKRTVDDNWTCRKIADELNALGVPPAYIRDGRTRLQGKRTHTVQGIWRPGRIRNMLVNETYKGIHHYGKRSQDADREIIARAVPAIVDEPTWARAQGALRSHLLFSSRNAKHPYLLRGLVKCGVCGLTYCGTAAHAPSGQLKRYYRCNGNSQARGIFGREDKKCPGKPVNADTLEALVWSDIEQFLRDPGEALAELAAQMQDQTTRLEVLRDAVADYKIRVGEKQAERDTVIALFRRGRIDDATLNRQLDLISEEEAELREQLTVRETAFAEASRAQDDLHSADVLLSELHARLDAPPEWEMKRQLVETLVGCVRIDTVTLDEGESRPKATITYLFSERHGHSIPIATRRGRDSSPPPAQSWRGR